MDEELQQLLGVLLAGVAVLVLVAGIGLLQWMRHHRAWSALSELAAREGWALTHPEGRRWHLEGPFDMGRWQAEAVRPKHAGQQSLSRRHRTVFTAPTRDPSRVWVRPRRVPSAAASLAAPLHDLAFGPGPAALERRAQACPIDPAFDAVFEVFCDDADHAAAHLPRPVRNTLLTEAAKRQAGLTLWIDAGALELQVGTDLVAADAVRAFVDLGLQLAAPGPQEGSVPS